MSRYILRCERHGYDFPYDRFQDALAGAGLCHGNGHGFELIGVTAEPSDDDAVAPSRKYDGLTGEERAEVEALRARAEP